MAPTLTMTAPSRATRRLAAAPALTQTAARVEGQQRAAVKKVEAVPSARGPKAPRRGPPQDTVWFRIFIGRERNADPKWILPLLCRRGGVTRDAIGKIVILPRETRFEVARAEAEAFTRAARKVDPRAPDLRIEPLRPAPHR